MARYARFAGRFMAIWAALSFLPVDTTLHSAGEDKITLGLHLKAGQTFSFVTIVESDLTQTIMGQEMNSASTVGMGYKYEVQHVADDGSATCKVTYDAVQGKMSMMGFVLEYDSAKPSASDSPFVKPLSTLVGQSFTLRVSPSGRVSDVQGVEAIYERMVKEIQLPDESMRGTVEQQLKVQFGADSIRENMEQAIGANFPDGPVDIGDTWVKRTTVARPYPMSLESTYTLKERRGGSAIIDVVSKVSTNPAGKPVQIGPMAMTYDLSGERKGQLEIEEASGWTIGAHITMQISGTIKAAGGPEGTMAFPIAGKINTRIEARK